MISTVVLVAAVVANALLAGLFFGFACAVVPGLRRVEDATYVRTFRAINRAILNPAFLIVFLGAPLLAAGAVLLWDQDAASRWWAVAGLVCAVATFAITAAINVPLNQRLEAAAARTEVELAAARAGFEQRWNAAHLVRTLTGVAAVVLLGISTTA